MKRFTLAGLLAVFSLIVIINFIFIESVRAQAEKATKTKEEIKISKAVFKNAMRKPWENYISNLRSYIKNVLKGNENTDMLYKDTEDIGDTIKPYFGDEAGKQLTSLLMDQIVKATEVMQAAKDNNYQALTKAQDAWNASADNIATFLSGATSHWSKQNLYEIFYKHLDLTSDEIMSRNANNADDEKEVYEKNQKQVILFADTIADGIIKQFPEKFKK